MSTDNMQIDYPRYQTPDSELDVIAELLPLEGARVLELGCGAAAMTRLIVENFAVDEIVATEVDQRQHAKNLTAPPLSRVRFQLGGAEKIDAPAASFDLVLMFKSLHHVPQPLMDAALAEIARVLKPGGLAYISEPVYAGDFNEILRLFHDEQQVREAAFTAIRRAVASGLFRLGQQRFFLSASHYPDFAEFERRIIQATHTEHRLDAALLERVKARFSEHLGADGAHFKQPIRVDLLIKPATA